MRHTKIVATLGPATSSEEMIEALIRAGVDVFRLNFSHGDHTGHKGLIDRIRAISKKLGRYTAILQDISGPKIRIGEVEGVLLLEVGDKLIYQKDMVVSNNVNKRVTLSHPEIIDSLEVGARVYLADGTIKTKIIEVRGSEVVAEVLVGGKLTSRKGVNFPDVKLPVPTITEKDRKDLEFGAKEGVDLVALSFVREAQDVIEAREICKKYSSNPLLFAKIEMAEAVENIDSILETVDGIMIARGDLGVELGFPKVPVIQKQIIKKANFKGLPVITATQMLTSMINSKFPTRAEVSDIANAVLDGSDALMLSDETAVGKYPIEAVKTLVESIEEIESVYSYYQHKNELHPKKEAIALSASALAETLEPKGIIVFSQSGLSALTLAKYRPKAKIIINSSCERTLRKMSVVWGVEQGFVLPDIESSDELIYRFLKYGLEKGIISKEHTYIMTIGAPVSKVGNTNLVRVMDKTIIEHMMGMFECSLKKI